ncbi:MAG: radical SAM-associated putative lipoprotein [Paludibacteraceae bacterium]
MKKWMLNKWVSKKRGLNKWVLNKWVLNKVNQMLTFCLSAMGLSGCLMAKYGIPDSMPVGYGCPYATFKAEGEVNNEEGEPIEGIKIVVREHNAMPIDAAHIFAKTEADGTYRTNEGETILPKDSVWIHAIDSTGTYAEDSTKVPVDYDRTQRGNWYEGDGEAKADFVLRKDKE